MQAAVDLLHQRVLADAEVAPFFLRIDLDRIRRHQRLFLEQFTCWRP
ncbi:globin family protein [Paludibaculum fermentans]|uniref:Uncharacterized protein n=1 Tax=Paludibaculum fermentans TaxID=1473598 RepID=A0A7S7NSU4_PALFE|nr:hypothetical protein IRI77_03910 [Paludibaculum fermentans]